MPTILEDNCNESLPQSDMTTLDPLLERVRNLPYVVFNKLKQDNELRCIQIFNKAVPKDILRIFLKLKNPEPFVIEYALETCVISDIDQIFNAIPKTLYVQGTNINYIHNNGFPTGLYFSFRIKKLFCISCSDKVYVAYPLNTLLVVKTTSESTSTIKFFKNYKGDLNFPTISEFTRYNGIVRQRYQKVDFSRHKLYSHIVYILDFYHHYRDYFEDYLCRIIINTNWDERYYYPSNFLDNAKGTAINIVINCQLRKIMPDFTSMPRTRNYILQNVAPDKLTIRLLRDFQPFTSYEKDLLLVQVKPNLLADFCSMVALSPPQRALAISRIPIMNLIAYPEIYHNVFNGWSLNERIVLFVRTIQRKINDLYNIFPKNDTTTRLALYRGVPALAKTYFCDLKTPTAVDYFFMHAKDPNCDIIIEQFATCTLAPIEEITLNILKQGYQKKSFVFLASPTEYEIDTAIMVAQARIGDLFKYLTTNKQKELVIQNVAFSVGDKEFDYPNNYHYLFVKVDPSKIVQVFKKCKNPTKQDRHYALLLCCPTCIHILYSVLTDATEEERTLALIRCEPTHLSELPLVTKSDALIALTRSPDKDKIIINMFTNFTYNFIREFVITYSPENINVLNMKLIVSNAISE